MKVSVDISPEHTEPYAVIYTSQMTDEIQRLLEVFGNSESPITALLNEEDLIILAIGKTVYADIEIHTDQLILYGQYRTRIQRNASAEVTKRL